MKKISVLLLSLLALSACDHSSGGSVSSAPLETRVAVPAPGPQVPTVLKKSQGVDCPKDALIDYRYLRQICLKETDTDFENCQKLNATFKKKHGQLDCEWSDSKGASHHIATVEGAGLDQGFAGTKEECASRSDEMKSIENDAQRISANRPSENIQQTTKLVRHSKGDQKVETSADLWREVFNFQDKYGTMKCDGETTSAFLKEMQSYEK